MSKISIHCLISGKVQGVWYRANTQKKAQELGVTGWVRNLPDGQVEALLCGEHSIVEQMITWLWQGPPLAKVTVVKTSQTNYEDFINFEIK